MKTVAGARLVASLGGGLAVWASPAMAHHEVVVATSIMPLASVIFAVTAALFAAWRQRRRRNRINGSKPRVRRSGRAGG